MLHYLWDWLTSLVPGPALPPGQVFLVSQQFNPASLLRALPALLAAGCSPDESAKTVGHGNPGVDLLPGPTAIEPSFSPPCWLKSDAGHPVLDLLVEV